MNLRFPSVQLVAANVDCIDMTCPAGEQDIGESAGRGADIETYTTSRVEAELIERGRKLYAAARHEGVRRLRVQDCVGGDFSRWFGDGFAIGRHEPRCDRGLRFAAALEQSTFNQQ